MNNILNSVLPLLSQYGYWIVFAALFLEDFGVPVPGETLLIAGSLLASQGKLHFLPLVAIAWSAAVLGDNAGYAIGRFGGRPLVLRFGRYLLITQKRLEYAESFFKKQGGLLVIAARFFEILRQLNGIVAGIAHMPWRRFLIFNMIGGALWVGFWSSLFYLFGKQADKQVAFFKKNELYFAGAVVLIVAAFILFLFLRKKRGTDPETNQGGDIS